MMNDSREEADLKPDLGEIEQTREPNPQRRRVAPTIVHKKEKGELSSEGSLGSEICFMGKMNRPFFFIGK